MKHSTRVLCSFARSAAVLGLLAAATGCGANGPGRYEVTGTVSYAGQPVPKGEVIFEPDPAKSNQGPQARAFIEQGKFRTSPGRGAVAGPVLVRVLAYDGKSHSESLNGSALCLPFESHLDLPAENSTQNFVIPEGLRSP